MAPGQQWLFRHSSPVQKDVVTRVVISDPHGYNSVGSAADAVVPLILWPFVHQHLDKFSDGLKKSALLKKSDISNKNLIV